VILECYVCEAKVDAKLIAEHVCDDDPGPFHSYLLECPQCHTTLLGGQAFFEDAPTRVWPLPDEYLSHHIPRVIRDSLDEARRCFKAKAYNACTVMAGRALEGICRHFGAKKVFLGPGIRQLREQEVIDARLARWAEELQKARNLGAHASGEKVLKDDAKDLLEFVGTICEYVFVLSKKFDEYMARRPKADSKSFPQVEPELPASEDV
jgi:HEPN domain-containing protein